MMKHNHLPSPNLYYQTWKTKNIAQNKDGWILGIRNVNPPPISLYIMHIKLISNEMSSHE